MLLGYINILNRYLHVNSLKW